MGSSPGVSAATQVLLDLLFRLFNIQIYDVYILNVLLYYFPLPQLPPKDSIPKHDHSSAYHQQLGQGQLHPQGHYHHSGQIKGQGGYDLGGGGHGGQDQYKGQGRSVGSGGQGSAVYHGGQKGNVSVV